MKIEFGTIEEFESWLVGKENKYELYVVKETSEVIATPLVSTRPIKIGVVKLNNVSVMNFLKRKNLQKTMKIYMADSFDFQVEK